MTALTINLCFQLDAAKIQDDGTVNKILGLSNMCLEDPAEPTILNGSGGEKHFVIMGPQGSHMTMHLYTCGLLTVDVHHLLQGTEPELQKTKFSNEYVKIMERNAKLYFGELCRFSRSVLSPIKRGEVTPYLTNGGDLLIEFDPVKLLYEVDSKWQNIKIYETESCGNTLFLDDDIMISEADDVYTDTLLGLGRNSFRDKTVLVLGGGDGGILHGLLKENPKHVLMAEIDEAVIKACRKHMRKVCGDSMDEFQGPNYEIRIDNCVSILEECLRVGRTFDFVVNDLSEFLLGSNIRFNYDFRTSSLILEMSSKLLNMDGKYLSRGCVAGAEQILSSIEEDAAFLGLNCKSFKFHVPSFREKYVTYEVWKDNN